MKFTPERRKNILKALQNGVPRKDAALKSGCSDRTLAAWLQRAVEDVEAGTSNKYTKFAEQVWKAEATWRDEMWDLAVEKAKEHPDPNKLLNILARRSPESYADPGSRAQEVTDKKRGGPIAQVMKQLGVENLQKMGGMTADGG